MIRILDVCSGTGSIERWIESSDLKDRVEVVSVDIQQVQGRTPTHQVDVCEWDFERQYPRHHFHVVWCSPPCQQYSIAKTTGAPRDLVTADRIVLRCQRIISYFDPPVWVMENPQTGLLKTRAIMEWMPYVDADYCQFGRSYKKPTRFWSNLASECPHVRNYFDKVVLKRCDPKTCHAMRDGKHVCIIAGPSSHRIPGVNKWLVGQIPESLLEALLGPAVRRMAQ